MLVFAAVTVAGAFLFGVMVLLALGGELSQRIIWAASLPLLFLVGCWIGGFETASVNSKGAFVNEQQISVHELEAGKSTMNRPAKSRNHALEHLEYGGCSLGVTSAEFLRRYPSAAMSGSAIDQREGLTSYTVPSLGGFDFLHDKLLQIRIIYSSASIEAAGGMDLVKMAFEQKLGEPDTTTNGTSFWFDGETVAALSEERGALFFFFSDEKAFSEWSRRKAQRIQLGF